MGEALLWVGAAPGPALVTSLRMQTSTGARHWELLTSRGWKGLIEHIMQCMYNLYGPYDGAW